MDNYDKLKAEATELGVDLFGVSETSRLERYFDNEIKQAAAGLPYTVTIAVRLSRKVFDTLTDGPNILYKHHYKTANFRLDDTTFRLGQYLQAESYDALPIPASVYTNWDKQQAHLSQRHAAINAGLGYQGLNGLLVHPDHGASVRLASILTDMPLRVDSSLDIDCGNCRACVKACPVNAISSLGPAEFDGQACYKRLQEHAQRRGMGVMICGLCIKACKGPNREPKR
ncbi:MAG: epoxyqueuosine reductase [candidate division Zixibacteria bacterium]|nr:epoxyqueuosine reductase [candidate division Zixibacteria bacterium]